MHHITNSPGDPCVGLQSMCVLYLPQSGYDVLFSASPSECKVSVTLRNLIKLGITHAPHHKVARLALCRSVDVCSRLEARRVGQGCIAWIDRGHHEERSS